MQISSNYFFLLFIKIKKSTEIMQITSGIEQHYKGIKTEYLKSILLGKNRNL